MKQIIAVDFDGALLKHRPFQDAHVKWFKVMAILLDDPSINEYACREDYFDKVHEVMERYLGDIPHESRVFFARNLYAMAVVEESKKSDLVAEFAAYLRKIKKRFTLALITSAPEASVDPILKKTGCTNLFDIVCKSPMHRHPDKKILFKEFIEKYEKPLFYIGNGDKDIANAKELGIKTISVNWVSEGNEKGDFDIKTVEELKEILE